MWVKITYLKLINLNRKCRQIHCIFLLSRNFSKHTYQLLLCLIKLLKIILTCIKAR